MLGVVDDEALERELENATVGVVTQQYAGAEFNIPSKLMNFMAYGLPVVAAVNPTGEVARIVTESNGGWVVSSDDPAAFPRLLAQLSERPDEIAAKSGAALQYARERFSVAGFAREFEEVLRAALEARGTAERAVRFAA